MMPSTTPCRLGDILLAEIKFTDQRSEKKRPVLVISNEDYHNSCNDVVIVPITSNIRPSRNIGDYRIAKWKEAGLVKESVAKGKPTTITRSTVERKLGSLASDDLREVLSRVRSILG